MSHILSKRRRCGILLPITALPDGAENGDFDSAPRFIDWLAKAGVTVWQILPLGPTHDDLSPYLCLSAHAGNPALIGLRWLAKQQFFEASASTGDRRQTLGQAYLLFRHRADAQLVAEYEAFVSDATHWLEDYATFFVLWQHHKQLSWTEWPQALRDRTPSALAQAQERWAQAIDEVKFTQFLFFKQWREIREYAQSRGVLIFGDMPLFVAHDSADVWANRHYFKLADNGTASVVAGVPPDYFSATGQRWGNPHYQWSAMQADGFSWWCERLETQLRLYDLVRLDHFRGLQASWEIPADSVTAEQGVWREAPGYALLESLKAGRHEIPLVAEDLGLITPEVLHLRDDFSLPGMAVLQFAFDGGSDNPYLPHNLEKHSVLYTGTHDNDTSLGWFNRLAQDQSVRVRSYLRCLKKDMPGALVASALASVAQWAVIPLQDILELGTSHRINTPGTRTGNWRWRFQWQQLTEQHAFDLRTQIDLYGR